MTPDLIVGALLIGAGCLTIIGFVAWCAWTEHKIRKALK